MDEDEAVTLKVKNSMLEKQVKRLRRTVRQYADHMRRHQRDCAVCQAVGQHDGSGGTESLDRFIARGGADEDLP